MAKQRNLHEFVVGFLGDDQIIYGQDHAGLLPTGWAKPATLRQARAMLRQFSSPGLTIYRLVRVDENGKPAKVEAKR